jgi:tetratricopeptide (TPR) repeat protein
MRSAFSGTIEHMRLHAVFMVFLACPALAQKPLSADFTFATAIAKLKAVDFAEAEAGFRTVAGLEPDRLRGYLGVAQVYMAQKKADEAIGYLRAEAEKMPNRADLRVAIGDTEVRAGLYDQALSEFQGVLKRLDPVADAELNVPRGVPGSTLPGMSAADSLAQSVQVLTVQDTTSKGEASIHLRLAELFRYKQDHSAAVREWQRTAELLPRTGWILASLGMEQEAAAKPEDAIKTYRESLAAQGENAMVLNNLAFLLAEHGGDLYEALRMARHAGNLVPGSPDILDTQGWIALKQGNLDDALGTFLRIVLRQPGRPEFRKHLAMALTLRGVHSKEIDELVKALNAPPVAGDDQNILALIDKTEKKQQ